jgi:hypothetical protein
MVFDLSGKVKMQSESGRELDLRHLSAGAYIIQLTDEKGNMEAHRIVKR